MIEINRSEAAGESENLFSRHAPAAENRTDLRESKWSAVRLWRAMPSYRVFIFVANRLVHSESFEAGDHIDAIRAGAAGRRGERIEIWDEKGRIAVIGTSRERRLPLADEPHARRRAPRRQSG